MPIDLTIRTGADIETALAALIEQPTEQFHVTVDPSLGSTIVLRGPSWDGMVDVRVAKYVLELQWAFDRARKETEVIDGDKPLVKVKVSQGSTDLIPQIVDAFTTTLQNMDSAHKLIVLLSIIGTGAGVFTVRQILEFLRVRQDRQLEHENNTGTVRELNQTIQRAIEVIDAERPIRALVAGMKENDTIELPASTTPLTRDQARTRYPRKPRVRPLDLHIDDNYVVDSVVLEHPVKLVLSKGDVTFRAMFAASLDAADREEFLAKIKTTLETRSSTRVALHVNASVNDVSVTSAIIVKIGQAPRADAEDILQYLD